MQVGAKPPKSLRLGYCPPRKRKLHDGKPVPRPAPVPVNDGSAASAMEPSTQTEQAEPEWHSPQQPEPEPMTGPTPLVMAVPASLKQTLRERECGYCIVSSALAMTGVPIDADELEAECHSVRTGDDPDGPIHNDPKRRMFSLPRCFTRLLSMCLLPHASVGKRYRATEMNAMCARLCVRLSCTGGGETEPGASRSV